MIRITDWNGGELICDELRLLNVNGDRRNDIPGDLTRLSTTIGVLDRMQVSAGRAALRLRNRHLPRGRHPHRRGFDRLGDPPHQLDPDNSFEFTVLNSIEVKGEMDGSFIRTRESIRDIDITRMIDSGILRRRPQPDRSGLPHQRRTGSTTTRTSARSPSRRRGRAGMANSFVVCGTSGGVRLPARDEQSAWASSASATRTWRVTSS